jgi:hypothetical protein
MKTCYGLAEFANAAGFYDHSFAGNNLRTTVINATAIFK